MPIRPAQVAFARSPRCSAIIAGWHHIIATEVAPRLRECENEMPAAMLLRGLPPVPLSAPLVTRACAGGQRVRSQIQFTSQVLPPSAEKACSMCAALGERLRQT